MRDPHVQTLRYALRSDESVRYHSPPPLDHHTTYFDLHVDDEVLTASPKVHYANEEEARNALESILRSWEASVFLRSGKEEVRFEFIDADLIDRDPPGPGEPSTIHVGFAEATSQVFPPSIIEGRAEYPRPPQYFALSPDVEVLLQRYRGYKQGREPLPAMAYFCLTVIKLRTAGQKRPQRDAAQLLNLDCDILNRIGRLTSDNRGDPLTARKYATNQQPLSTNETYWLEAAVRSVIRQLAVLDDGERPPHLSLNDLPRL